MIYDVKIQHPKRVEKKWGYELWVHNDADYCGKLLVFTKSGNKFSMHYHMIKDETWYVDKGEFLYRWIDTQTANVIEQKLIVGDTVRQRPGQPHQLEALTDGVIFEVSTTHSDSDSYRVWKGDSQK